ncbi:HAD family hydrolase [Williamsia sp. MIQD14]|uniref:HAD family hydrolase n=1 Tax=Williamsia sp. MIQD14 TaxID=3425703 RepID=UPI003DA17E46
MAPADPGNGALPRAVLWDMDGTLLDSEKLWDVAMAELAVRLGAVMTVELRQSTLGNSMVGAMTKLFDAAGVPEAQRDLDGQAHWLRGRVAELFADGIPWRPGADAALRTIAAAGIPMVLVTNTERDLTERALPTIGKHRFAHTLCGDEVAEGKPAPDLYLAAARAAGVPPADCLAIEDSPTGAAAAGAAGCPTLVVPSDADVPQAPGRTFRESLVGLDEAAVSDAWRRGRAGHAAVGD